MERRGIYRKGSAGHARNINTYQLYRQKYKKWRLPFAVLLAFTLIFGTVPGTGEIFQTSLLTANQKQELSQVKPELARKTILNELRVFVDSCKKYKIAECSEKGELVINDVVNSGDAVLATLDGVENFVAQYEAEVARDACKFELSTQMTALQDAKKSVAEFLNRYFDVLPDASLKDGSKKLDEAVSSLGMFTDSCFE